MARPCSICTHSERLEIDRLLLSGESYRKIAERFGLSTGSISRHRVAHVGTDLRDVREVMIQAREEALAEVKAEIKDEVKTRSLEDVKAEVIAEARESIASRLELCKSHFDQLRVLRERAAIALETAEGAEDVKVALLAIKELRELVRLWGELEGKLQSQPTVNILVAPQWLELRTIIVSALRPHPEALEAVLAALPDEPMRS